jgi:hypothetical protein
MNFSILLLYPNVFTLEEIIDNRIINKISLANDQLHGTQSNIGMFLAFYNTRNAISVFTTPPLNPIPRQLNAVHTLSSYCFKIYFNTILPRTPLK